MSYRIGGAKWNLQPFNGPANLSFIVGEVSVLYNTTAVKLSWGTVPGTQYYELQISMFPDFRSNFVDTSLTASNYTFTDGQTNDAKRWWRWRPSAVAGAGFLAPWSEVGSYWLDTGAAGTVEVPEGYWTIFDQDDVLDSYTFDLAPIFTIVPRNLYRFQARNRAGALLSEFLTVKDDLMLDFTGSQYIIHAQMDEFQRFHNTKRTFFITSYIKWRYGEPMANIWKVECTQDPTFTMIAAGRSDLVRGSVTLTEV